MTNYKRVQLITTLFCIAATAQTTTSTGVVFVSSPYYAYFLPRNNYTGTVGFAFSMSTSVTVNKLGRLYVPGNAGNHVVNLWRASDHAQLASATVFATSASDPWGYKWANIFSPVFLSSGVLYLLTVDEIAGGDYWADTWNPGADKILDPKFTISYAAYGPSSQYPLYSGLAGSAYSVPNIQYQYQTSTSSFGTVPIILTATDATTDIMRFYRNNQTTTPLGARIGANGQYETNAWVTVSGTLNITPPSAEPYMIGVVSDVGGPAVVIRDSGVFNSSILKGLDQNGVPVFGVATNGTMNAGGGSPNRAVCWKTDGRTLGYCSTQPDATGSCACR
jgi:hypothetical protein